MATVTVTSTPATLDATGAAELGVTNTGSVAVFVNSQRVRPGQRMVFDARQPLAVVTQGGAGTSTVDTDVVASTQTAIASVSSYLTNPNGLRKWYAALGRRRNAPARIAVNGNSNWEGTGATNYADRLPLVLQDDLRNRLQPAGILGAPIAQFGFPNMTPLPANLPYTATTGVSNASQFGLGARGFKITGTGALTVPFTGDRVRVTYTRAGGAGILNIVLDGGTPVLRDAYLSAPNAALNWDSGALTRGPHTLTVTRDPTTVAGRDIYLNSIELFDGDWAAGIRVYDHARHGVALTNLDPSWMNEYTQLGPFGLLIMGWGENDTALDKAGYKSAMLSMIASHRTAGHASSILLAHGPKPGGVAQALWDDYRDAEREIALADADITALDMAPAVPGYDNGGQGVGIMFDNKHFNSAGQGWRADLLAQVLVPR
jgi:hypothetical protein